MIKQLLTDLSEIKDLLREKNLLSRDILTVEQASDFLGLSLSSLYKHTSSRRLPHYKPTNGKIYFRRAELETWILSNVRPEIQELVPAKKSFNIVHRKKKSLAA
ncbi:MAG TPA: helix-turn-helix domain-containing protein [Chryseolinea sp.]|nr:helix-turn-helix domain-containing protein [Chryseolinea sp.]